MKENICSGFHSMWWNLMKISCGHLWWKVLFLHIFWLQNVQQMNRNVMVFYNQLSSYLQAFWIASDPLNFNGRYHTWYTNFIQEDFLFKLQYLGTNCMWPSQERESLEGKMMKTMLHYGDTSHIPFFTIISHVCMWVYKDWSLWLGVTLLSFWHK